MWQNEFPNLSVNVVCAELHFMTSINVLITCIVFGLKIIYFIFNNSPSKHEGSLTTGKHNFYAKH